MKEWARRVLPGGGEGRGLDGYSDLTRALLLGRGIRDREEAEIFVEMEQLMATNSVMMGTM